MNCGRAPNFTGITTWLNTPGGKPLSLSRRCAARSSSSTSGPTRASTASGRCPTSKPGTREYAKDGFVVVGVHTPEFAFEHVVSNVRAAGRGTRSAVPGRHRRQLRHVERLQQPVLAGRLPDRRHRATSAHVHFGEGDYSTMGQLIRQLLQAAASSPVTLPTPADVPDKTPAGQMNPETYLGYEELQYLDPPEVTRDAPAVYHFPASLPLGALGLAGTWTDHAQEATAGQGAELELRFPRPGRLPGARGHRARSTSPSTATIRRPSTSAGVPRLYTPLPGPGGLGRERKARCCMPHRASRPTTSPLADFTLGWHRRCRRAPGRGRRLSARSCG